MAAREDDKLIQRQKFCSQRRKGERGSGLCESVSGKEDVWALCASTKSCLANSKISIPAGIFFVLPKGILLITYDLS